MSLDESFPGVFCSRTMKRQPCFDFKSDGTSGCEVVGAGMPLLADSITVRRRQPANLAAQDEHLFLHDYVREIPAARCQRLVNVCLGASGTRWKGAIPSQSVNRLAGQPLSHYRFARAIARECLQPVSMLEDGIWVCDAWALEYFHWLADMLPKILLADESLPVILPPGALDRDYVRTSLAMLGRRPVTMPADHRASIGRLDVITAVAPTGNFRPKLVQEVKAHLVTESGDDGGARLYITRSRAPRRRILNEQDLESMLQDFGFTSVCLEDYSWKAQIEMVSRASVLVGLHGAGLANMMFMAGGGQVLEFRRRGDAHNNCYFALASAADLDYFYLQCDGTSANTFDADFTVDISGARTIIASMLQSHPRA